MEPIIQFSQERHWTIFEEERFAESGEEPPEFWGFTCHDCNDPIIIIQSVVMATWPDRCQECEKMKSRHVRAKKMKKRVQKQYDELDNPYVGFLTLTMPGEYAGRITESVIESVYQARIDLYSSWTKFWRNYLKHHCVGAYRFFEWTENPNLLQEHLDDSDPTTVDMRVHPHLHVLVLQEGRTINISELREKATNAGFGEQIDMKWKKDVSGFRSIDYCLSYVKKDLQVEGRNRQGYGVFMGGNFLIGKTLNNLTSTSSNVS